MSTTTDTAAEHIEQAQRLLEHNWTIAAGQMARCALHERFHALWTGLKPRRCLRTRDFLKALSSQGVIDYHKHYGIARQYLFAE